MVNADNLPPYLTENKASKAFVYRHHNLNDRKGVYFYYSRGKDHEEIRGKAVRYALRMNKKLGPAPSSSPEGRMTVRNLSGEVGVDVKTYHSIKKSGREYTYYYWRASWVGCPKRGGICWSILDYDEKDAYVLAVLTRRMKLVSKERVQATFAKISPAKYEKILTLRIAE